MNREGEKRANVAITTGVAQSSGVASCHLPETQRGGHASSAPGSAAQSHMRRGRGMTTIARDRDTKPFGAKSGGGKAHI